MPRTEAIDGRLLNKNMSSNAAEFEFKFDSSGESQWAPFSVLDTDGHTYMIVYSC